VGGAVLLMAWDLVLDPAMSQTSLPFWEFEEIGEFFGMPYRNLSGWVATGMVFMSVAALLWRGQRLNLTRSQLTVPVIVYLVNFAFGAAITVFSLDPGFLVPTMMSVAIGVLPAVLLWAIAPTEAPNAEPAETAPLNAPPLEVVAK
jgi:putative membrane protein